LNNKIALTRLLRVVILMLVCVCTPAVSRAQATDRESIYQASLADYKDDISIPLAPVIVDSGVSAGCTWQKILYTGQSERVPALLYLPNRTVSTLPVPCLILLHGLGGNKSSTIPMAIELASLGYASLSIDEANAGQRMSAAGQFPPFSSLDQLTTTLVALTTETIVDLRRGMDYLDLRPEIDHGHVGVIGTSLGALLGALFAGIDPRVDAVVLISGGGNLSELLIGGALNGTGYGRAYPGLLRGADPVWLENQLSCVEPLNFVAHISPHPLLMEHGRLDGIVPPDTAQALFDAALQPKSIQWYPNDGHVPPSNDTFPSITMFLQKYMPVSSQVPVSNAQSN
jgi:cephalosporin-C deacetylase-like acetyl esterase